MSNARALIICTRNAKHSKAIPTDLTRIVASNKKEQKRRVEGGDRLLREAVKLQLLYRSAHLPSKMLIQRGQANDHAPPPPYYYYSLPARQLHSRTTQRGVMRFRQSYLPRLLYLIPQCLDSGGNPSLSFGCTTTRGGQGVGGVHCCSG